MMTTTDRMAALAGVRESGAYGWDRMGNGLTHIHCRRSGLTCCVDSRTGAYVHGGFEPSALVVEALTGVRVARDPEAARIDRAIVDGVPLARI
jgi:hypothetical protein